MYATSLLCCLSNNSTSLAPAGFYPIVAPHSTLQNEYGYVTFSHANGSPAGADFVLVLAADSKSLPASAALALTLHYLKDGRNSQSVQQDRCYNQNYSF